MTSQSEKQIFNEFKRCVARNSDAPAVFYSNNNQFVPKTYGEIYQQSLKLDAYLKEKGIKAGDKVSIVAENSPGFIEIFMAVMKTGATAVLLDSQSSPKEVERLVNHSESNLLVLSQYSFGLLKENLPKEVEIIIIDNKSFQDHIQSLSVNEKDVDMDVVRKPAVLFYTSGTTDLPKAVMLSHANLLSNVASIVDLNLVTEKDCVISFLPLHHAYAFTVTMLLPLLTGAKIAYPASLNSLDLIKCIKDNGVSIFVGVPQVFNIIHKSIDEKIKKAGKVKSLISVGLGGLFYGIRKCTGVNLSKKLFGKVHEAFGSNLRYMVSGGARLESDVATGFEKLGFTVLEGYGLTETSPVVTFNRANQTKIGSVGKPIKDVKIKLLDKDENGIGEVAISGPNVMLGYYKLPEETKKVLEDGWFKTGDLGFVDAAGFLNLTGRKKEVIILSNGKNIYPDEIERFYNQNPFVKEMGVISYDVSGFAGEQQLVGIIVVDEEHFKRENQSNIREKLKWELDNMSAKLPTYKRIKGFEVLTHELPKTRLGKLKRFELKNIYENIIAPKKSDQVEIKQKSHPDQSMGALAFLESTLGKKVHLEDHLELDLGLDSLGRIELLMGLQEHLNLELSDDQAMDFFMCSTVKDLQKKLRELNGGESMEPDHTASSQVAVDWKDLLKEEPSAESLAKVKLKFGVMAIVFNLVVITLFKIVFKVLFLLKVNGVANLPKCGPYLICPNHTSYFDGLFILSALPYKVALNTYFLGLSAFFESGALKRFVRVARLIPIEMGFNLLEALRICRYVLERDKIVVYFPEGQRSIDGEVKEFKNGVGILASELAVSVVPVYLQGAQNTWGRQHRWPRLSRVTVKIGKPIDSNNLCESSKKDSDQNYEVLAEGIRKKVVELI